MQIKAQGLINGAAWVLETHGSAVLSEILAGCSAGIRERYMTGIAIEWHDGAEFEEFLREAERCLGGPAGLVAREIGAAGARRSMKGMMHRLAFYAARRDYALARVAALWRRFNGDGEMTLEQAGSHGYVMRVSGAQLPGILFCASITGWLSVIAERVGIENPSIIHQLCTTRGDQACTWTVQWNPDDAVDGDA